MNFNTKTNSINCLCGYMGYHSLPERVNDWMVVHIEHIEYFTKMNPDVKMIELNDVVINTSRVIEHISRLKSTSLLKMKNINYIHSNNQNVMRNIINLIDNLTDVQKSHYLAIMTIAKMDYCW